MSASWEQNVSVPAMTTVSWDFRGKVVVVTGAARGIGRSHALCFARAGADVVVADACVDVETVPWAMGSEADLAETAEAVEANGVRAVRVRCDVRSRRDVQELVDASLAALGRIDILINNAGIYPFAHVTEMPEEHWDDVLDTNLKGVFLSSQAVAGPMMERRSGKIVTIGSTSSFVGGGHNTAYAASKHGVVGLTKSLAIDLGPFGINVNAVCPGAVYTPHILPFLHELADRDAERPQREQVLGLGGVWNVFNDEALHPQDVSNAAMFLASDAARFITGQTIVVDTGFTAK